MQHFPSTKAMSLAGRADALTRTREMLKKRIQVEQKRPLPCAETLQRLKKMRLLAKDELSAIQGVISTVDRGQRRLHSA